jgi:ribosomal protein S18 acetylase RimI-like enzyme
MSERQAAAPFSLRAATPADEAFLRELYRSTRRDELGAASSSAREFEAFCSMQFDAQTRGYRLAYPDAEHLIIRHGGVDAGRLIKWRSESGFTLVDLALAPAYRNRGLGGSVVRGLQQEARRASTSLSLQVEQSSRAVAFYRRLGFAVTGEDGVRFTMIWPADAAGPGKRVSSIY